MKIVEVVNKFNLLIKEFAEKKEAFCNSPGKDFSRKRKQDFEQIIRSVLSLDGGSLTNEILRIHKYSGDAPSASAFIQQRAKLSETAFPSLFRTINRTFDKDYRYAGYRMIAVDGSHIHVPNNPNDPDSYVCSRENEHFHNEFPFNAFWDILQGTFIDVILQKYRTQNEDQALLDMVERSELKDVRVKEIYGMRWGIENSFRDLKYIVGLLRFHSKKSQFVIQEIYANLIMHNMAVITAACEKITKKKTKHIYKIRFSTAANIVKRLLAGDASPPAAEVLIQRNLSPVRPNRKYPRKKTPLKASIHFVYRIA